ncbi:MAG: flippase, partial [Epsilonproteobacteria bacterium]|nr:flippase [Campylobacterota bacterium]
MKEEYKRLVSNFTALLTLQGANYLLPLITFPYLVRVLGVEKFGLVSFAMALTAYFNIIVDYGFNLTATKDVSIHRHDREYLSKIVSSVFIIKFALLILSFGILMGLILFVEKFSSHPYLYLFSFGIVFGQMLFPQWFFQGIERMEYITFLNLVAKILFTIAIFLFVHTQDDFYKVPFIQSLGYMVAGVMALWIIATRHGLRAVFDWHKIRYYIVYNFSFFLSRLAVNLYTVSNTFILGLFFHAQVVGQYSIAEKVVKIVQSLYGILTQTLYPYIVKSKNVGLFKKVLFAATLLNILFMAVLAYGAEYIFDLLFHIHDQEILKIFYVLCVVSLFILPTYLLGFPILGAFGYEKYANLSAIYGAILHLALLGGLIFFDLLSGYSVAL